MAQFGDFLARLVTAGGTRGLSGDADRVLPAEAVFAYFNDRLRKHHTSENLVADPSLLWSTQSFLSRRGGLEAHLRAERADGVAGFSDILVVINADDWRQSLRQLREPWAGQAGFVLSQRFRKFCEANDFHALFPQRPMGVRVIEDGGLSMEGASLGLMRGEFVTGLLPNFYGGAQATSRPIVGFHLNIPGAWEGYREVGRLYSDQVLFTLGNHWLDNFRHPHLQLPALYRLQQFADGSFIHIVNPEAMPDVQIVEQESNGATVITLQHISGVALAHIVLAMIDGESSIGGASRTATPPSEASTEEVPVTDKVPAAQVIEEPSRSIAPAVPAIFGHQRTVVPAEVDAKLLTLRERGVLLQRVHFARFMTGYNVYVGPGGEVGTALEAPSATLQVRKRRICVVAHVPGLTLDGTPLPPGRPVELSGDQRLAVQGTKLDLRDLSGVKLPNWPYLLEIRRPGGSSHLVFGRTHPFGRDPRCSVRLPDEPHNGNIVWRPEVQQSRVIRSRNGQIPKSRFYIDSIMVASEHAELDLSGEPCLRGRARDCYSYVRRGDELLPIAPTRRETGRREVILQPLDELLIGNSVFQVGWDDASLNIEPLTAEVLAAAVDEIQMLEGPSVRIVAAAPLALPPPVDPAVASPSAVPSPPSQAAPSPGPTPADDSRPTPEHRAGLPPGAPPEEPIIGPPMIPGDTADVQPVEPSVGPPMIPGDTADVQPVETIIGPPMIPGDTADVQPVEPIIGPPMIPGDTADVQPVDPLELPEASLPELESIRTELHGDRDETELPSDALPSASLPQVPPPDDLPEHPDTTDRVSRPPVLPPDVLGATAQAPAPPAAAPPAPSSEASFSATPESLPPEPAFIPRPKPARPLRPALQPPGIPAVDIRVGSDGQGVVVIDEATWQLELGRPARLVTTGWMVVGQVVIGNHTGCDVILPENRMGSEQTFPLLTMAKLKVRGGRGWLRSSAANGVELTQAGEPTSEATDLSQARLEVVRYDADGDEDFRICLTLEADRSLPDPRARRLIIDRRDPMVEGLFTVGLPLRSPRRVRLGPVTATARWTGTGLLLSDYLGTYRKPNGTFHPVFTRQGNQRFVTLPEDGRAVTLGPGDVILARNQWIELVATESTENS